MTPQLVRPPPLGSPISALPHTELSLSRNRSVSPKGQRAPGKKGRELWSPLPSTGPGTKKAPRQGEGVTDGWRRAHLATVLGLRIVWAF